MSQDYKAAYAGSNYSRSSLSRSLYGSSSRTAGDAETSPFWGRHTSDVLRHLKEVNSLISETESASLSYQVTGEPEWENQLLTLRRTLDTTLESTRSLISDNPRQLSNMQDLLRQIGDLQNHTDLQNHSDQQNPSGLGAAPSGPSNTIAENTRFNGPYQTLNRSIKGILGKMTLEENDLLTQRIAKNKSNCAKTFYMTRVSGIFAFTLIIIILIQLNKDIRRRKLAEEEVRENQDMLQSIMDNAPLIIYLKDLEARYLMVNNKFKELMQVDETVIGRSAAEVNKDKEATQRRLKKDKIVITTKKPEQMEESVDTPEGLRHFSMTKFSLEKAGAHADLAANGREAIGHIRNGGIYDLVIMDLQMPEMDGYETTRYLRLEMSNPTPIIAMTATAMLGEKTKCLETGMNDYMSKPFEFTDLYKRIIALTGRTPAPNPFRDQPNSFRHLATASIVYPYSILQLLIKHTRLMMHIRLFCELIKTECGKRRVRPRRLDPKTHPPRNDNGKL